MASQTKSQPRAKASKNERVALATFGGHAIVALLIVLGLIALVIISYWPVRWNRIVFCDDPIYVQDNPHVTAGLTANSIAWAFSTLYAANWHPLTWLSLMLDVQLWGTGIKPHHWVNVGLHGLNCVVLFLFLRQVSGTVWRSGFVAALFAVHPLHVESVAWASERKDVLCALFFILALWCYCIHATRKRWRWYGLTMVCFVLALLSKPMAVTLPFVCLLLDAWPLRRLKLESPAPARGLWRLLLEKIPLFALSAAASAITFVAQQRGGAVMSTQKLPLAQRLGNAAVSYVLYAGKMLAPIHLAFFYPTRDWPGWLVAGSLLLLLLITAAVIWQARRRPYLVVGWLIFLGMLVPVIGLVQVGIQSMADRYMYLPMIGLGVMLAWGTAELAERWRARAAAGVVGCIAIVTCAILTQRQVRYWHDTITLTQHAIDVVGDDPFVCTILGIGYANEREYPKAIDTLLRAIDARPNDILPLTLTDLGNVYVRVRDWEHAKECFDRVDRAHPDDAANLGSLGDYYFARGDLDDAVSAYERSLRAVSEQDLVRSNLAMVFIRQHRFDRAVPLLEQVLKANPNDSGRQYQLGMALVRLGRFDEAAAHLNKSLLLYQKAPQPHYQLARVSLAKKDVRGGIAQLRAALALDANYVAAAQDLAWILATAPDASVRDAKEALKLAERADELSLHANPEILDTLAAAYAANGEFAKAVDVAQKAIDLANRQEKKELVPGMETRLELYRSGKGFLDRSLEPTPAGT